MREKWQKEWEDKVIYENDANDFYYEWVDFAETRLIDLFQEWFGVDINQDVSVKIKARKGSVFITRIKDRQEEMENNEHPKIGKRK